MPTKFVKSSFAAVVGALVAGSHAPAKLHTQSRLGRPGGLNPFVGHVGALKLARLPT
jgi:hypothetical protein